MDPYSTYVHRIDHHLACRETEWPQRGTHYQAARSAIHEFSLWLIREGDYRGLRVPAGALERADAFLTRPIVLCGGMKSGTTLLSQLLDGHPNLLVPPGSARYFQRYCKRKLGFEKTALKWIRKLVDPTGQRPFWPIGKERDVFFAFLGSLHHLFEISEVDDDLKGLISFYLVSRKEKEGVTHWVERTTRNEFYVPKIKKAFPQALFVHIIRDPIENITSLLKWSGYKDKYNDIHYWIYSVKSQLNKAINNVNFLGEKEYRIIKYEEIVKNPQLELHSLCQFLSIPFDENLLIPTKGGMPAVSNSMYADDRATGVVFQEKNHAKWKAALSEAEKKQIVSALFQEATRLEYAYWNDEEIKQYESSRPLCMGYFKYLWAKLKNRSRLMMDW